MTLPGATATPTPAQHKKSAAKTKALLKAVGTSLKGAIKGRAAKWHEGDRAMLAGSTVCDADEFAALFPGVVLTKKGVTTSFSLGASDIARAFGDLKCKIPTWTQSHRAFQKAYKTGSKEVTLPSAEGKYSSGTSTVTIKFDVRVAGGYGGSYGGYGSFGGLGHGDDY